MILKAVQPRAVLLDLGFKNAPGRELSVMLGEQAGPVILLSEPGVALRLTGPFPLTFVIRRDQSSELIWAAVQQALSGLGSFRLRQSGSEP